MSQGVFSKASILDLYGQPSAVANPPANTARLYYNAGTNALVAVDSSGTNLIVGTGAFLPLSGGTMTGTIGFSGSVDPINSFVSNPSGGTRNNYTSSVGMAFTVSSPVTVSRLGRRYATGSGNHVVNIWAGTNGTPIATGTVLAASTSDSNSFKWVSITPVILSPGTTYTIGIDELNGGDSWYDSFAPSLQTVFTCVENRYGNDGAVSVRPTNTANPSNTYSSPAMDIGSASTIIGISRDSVGELTIGNGTAGDFTGTLKLGNQILTAVAPVVAAAQVSFGSTTATTANAGSVQNVPATVLGYLVANVGGTTVKIPYFAN
jgi:hypothetical protein